MSSFIRLIPAIFCISSIVHAQVEVKFNAATALLLIPNAGVELGISEKHSIQLDVLGSFWDEMPLLNDTPFHLSQTFLEYRFYKKEGLQKWFIAPHVGFGMFTLQKPNYLILYDYYNEAAGGNSGGGLPNDDTYQSGRVAFYGLTFGYKKKLNTSWSIEAFMGLGLSQSWYKGYKGIERVDYLVDGYLRPFNGSGEVLIYKGGLMVVYKLPYVKNLL